MVGRARQRDGLGPVADDLLAPSGHRYRVNVNFHDVNDSRTLALACVPARSRVLDVGIGDGSVARVLRKLRCRVWGIEVDKLLAHEAADLYESLVIGDVTEVDLGDAFEGQRFDVVLLLDVLEHTTRPAEVLASVASVLEPDGWVVVSLPNVTHAAVRLQLLGGQFTYTPEGLLDSTHLRFFDRRHVDLLFAEAGFSVLDSMRVTRPVDGTEIPVDLTSVPPEVLDAIRSDPEHQTYQFVSVVVPDGSPCLDDPPLLPTRLVQQACRARDETIAELRASRSRFLADDAALEWIDGELERMRERTRQHRQAIWDLVGEFRAVIAQLGGSAEQQLPPG
jgi:2-polyprenyl-3-methyl-5-hydroxy-6-metoxy-1,4-benzoquinol methylase